ncbi:hypothetical protein JCM8097_008317 [Rhodosporidiobolus ruineniae]
MADFELPAFAEFTFTLPKTSTNAATASPPSPASPAFTPPREYDPPPTRTSTAVGATPPPRASIFKRFYERTERYSLVTGKWDEVGVEQISSCGHYLFTAVHRMWPKHPQYEGYEDHTDLHIHSRTLVRILRHDISELSTSEGMYDDKPAVRDPELFHAAEQIERVLQEKKELVKELAAEEEEEDKAGKNGRKTAELATGAAEEKVEAVKKEGSRLGLDDYEALWDDGDAVDGSGADEEKVKTRAEVKEEVDHLGVLVEWLNEKFGSTRAFRPQISDELLWAVFKRNSLAVTAHDVSGERQGFRITHASYMKTSDGPVFAVSGTFREWTGSKYKKTHISVRVPKFNGLQPFSALPIEPLEPGLPLHNELTARGKRYCELTGDAGDGGCRFLNYGGVLMQSIGGRSEKRVIRLRAEGRAVVDVKSYRRMNPSDYISPRDDRYDAEDDYGDHYGYRRDDDGYGGHRHVPRRSAAASPTFSNALPPAELCLLPPTVFGFSLVHREWGELTVELFSPIEFRDEAWDLLVLEEETKVLVKGLVESNEAVRRAQGRGRGTRKAGGNSEEEEEAEEKKPKLVTDIIEGKGGGLVIALHGLPGTGKTLTAEAVAESLRVPLYTVGAGSLGVHADVLEKRLRDTLDVAEGWGAVLLIDEADVFLEERSRTDVARNAMVSVFLRMLEHHSGVLFLTTNRIDEAFMSRFSLAITYPALDKSSRKLIYLHFLALAGVGIEGAPESAATLNEVKPAEGKSNISAKYLDKIAGYAGFNGRQIKNIVRTAQSLALSQSVPLTETQLDVVIKTAQDFQRDLDEADEKGVYEAKGEGWKDRTNVFI